MTVAVPCLAIGSDVVRWTVPGRDDRAHESLSYFWRDKRGELPPFVGELTCDRSFRFVPLRLGDWSDAEVAGPLTGLLREVRRDATTLRWRKPSRVFVALSPAFASRLGPLVPVAARAAGFRRATVIDEAACLVAAAGARRPLVIVDVGDAETRFLVWSGSSSVPDAATSVPVGGRHLIDDMRAGIRAAGLIVGSPAARRLADAEGDWPRSTKGYDPSAKLPRRMDVERDTVLAAVGPAEAEIAAGCADAVTRVPGVATGAWHVLLTGGAAAFVGLREAITSRTSMPVEVDARPGAEVLRGLRSLAAIDRESSPLRR